MLPYILAACDETDSVSSCRGSNKETASKQHYVCEFKVDIQIYASGDDE